MKPPRSKKHQKKDAYNPSLVTVEEKEDEWNAEGAEGADEETKAGENENEEAKENLDNHDLDIFFEAEVVERKDEGEEYYAKEGDYNYQEGFDEEDTFYDMEGIFDYEDDEDMYYDLEDSMER